MSDLRHLPHEDRVKVRDAEQSDEILQRLETAFMELSTIQRNHVLDPKSEAWLTVASESVRGLLLDRREALHNETLSHE